jgi:GDP-L-fucose synthase
MTEPPILFPLRGRRIFVAGHRGMVGSAILRGLEERGDAAALLTAERGELDLSRQAEVEAWFERHRPEAVFLAAAKVGGILANATRPAEFIGENLAIELNVIAAAHRVGVQKLLFLGSSCIYPRLAPQPIPETALLTGELEPTNEWYAVAKIAGMKLCEAYRRQHGSDFISVMPTNLYGTNDSFDLQSSHVLPALIAKAHRAKRAGAATLEVWGTGNPRREFLHVDDLADASIYLMERYSAPEPVNIGTGEDLSIRELAELVCRIVGFGGTLVFDTAKPDGTPRKLLDVSRLRALGWRHRISLEEGVRQTYCWYVSTQGEAFAS